VLLSSDKRARGTEVVFRRGGQHRTAKEGLLRKKRLSQAVLSRPTILAVEKRKGRRARRK